jgi:ribonuclease BN (tRNA processing enzyme)
LLRARALGQARQHYQCTRCREQWTPSSPDNPRILADAYTLREFTAGHRFEAGPFEVDAWTLPHFVPNAGMKLTADGHVLAYTGDTGPTPDIVTMARDADVLLAEVTFPGHEVPAHDAAYLPTARQAGEYAAQADVKRLILTHLWPGTDPSTTYAAAQRVYSADLDIAAPGITIAQGMTIDLG